NRAAHGIRGGLAPRRSLDRIAAMRSHPSRSRWRVWTLGVLTFLLVAMVQTAAWAQLTIQPTATPSRDTGGWVYWMAEAAIGISVVIVLLVAATYLRF